MKNRAIINVSDTSLLAEFSRELVELGYEILCAKDNISVLEENGVEYTAITDDSPVNSSIGVRMEVMRSDIFAAILADRSDTEHISTIISSGIEPIDIVVTNFEDVKQLLSDKNKNITSIFPDVDINRSSLIKAGISNCDDVCVVIDPSDYETVLEEIKNGGEVSKETRFKFAVKALSYLCGRDAFISSYLNLRIVGDTYPDTMNIAYEKLANFKCGENVHQAAAVYERLDSEPDSLCNMKKLQGKALSFNGFNNADIALETVSDFDECTVVFVNNGCICGVGIGDDIYEAYSNAYRLALPAISGSVVVFNRIVDRKCALELVKYSFEGVIAPGYGADTEDLLSQKDGLNLFIKENFTNKPYDIKSVNGGILIQKNKGMISCEPEFQCVTQRQPDENEKKDLLFAWRVAKNVKTSAVVLAKSGQTIGIGGGQPLYSTSLTIAVNNAGTKAEGSVAAVDSNVDSVEFFEILKEAGVTAIIQAGIPEVPREVIEMCNDNQIAMITTNVENCKY